MKAAKRRRVRRVPATIPLTEHRRLLREVRIEATGDCTRMLKHTREALANEYARKLQRIREALAATKFRLGAAGAARGRRSLEAATVRAEAVQVAVSDARDDLAGLFAVLRELGLRPFEVEADHPIRT